MPGAVAQRNNPANDPNAKPIKHHSSFRPNSTVNCGQRYADVSPLFAMPVVQGDHVDLRVNADVDTYTLQAPIMAPVRRNTTAVYAPLRAILPDNYELLVTNPLTGDDIDPELVNTVSKFAGLGIVLGINQTEPTDLPSTTGYLGKLNYYLRRASGWSDTSYYDVAVAANKKASTVNALSFLCATLPILDKFVSTGSVANTLGLNFTKYIHFMSFRDISDTTPEENMSYDKFIDLVCAFVRDRLTRFTVNMVLPALNGSQEVEKTETYVVYTGDRVPDGVKFGILFRDFLQMLRNGYCVSSFTPYFVSDIEDKPYLVDGVGDRYIVVSDIEQSSSSDDFFTAYGFKQSINYGRLISYQLACVQFFTDDAVDYVYTPSLYHQNQMAMVYNVLASSELFYTLNGTRHMYDSVSGHVFDSILSAWMDSLMSNFWYADVSSSTANYSVRSQLMIDLLWCNNYLNNIFGFQSSLRYRDYFVGSRKHPLGIGDTDVTVNDGKVDVVDITKSIQMQRFLNQVNRIGRTLKAYTRGIFGVTPATNPEECIFLCNTVDIIGGEETNNTAEAQQSQPNSTTSKFRGESSKYLFQIDCSDPGYVIVMNWYEITRPYVDAVPRDIFHVDRFDMFNPFIENTGDQALFLPELGLHLKDANFAYKMRYAEYKQSFDRAVGPFAQDGILPGYALPVESSQLFSPGADEQVLSPYFIRPRNSEFDPLYLSLTHYSTANYFHFIVRADVEVNALRPMEAAPQIL